MKGIGESDHRLGVLWIDLHRAFEVVTSRCNAFLRRRLPMRSPPTHHQINRIGIGGVRASLRLGLYQLVAQRIGESCHDLILQLEHVGDVLLEPVGPEMSAGLAIDKLRVDAHMVLVALHRAFEELRSIMPICISIAEAHPASTTLLNSMRTPSPVRLMSWPLPGGRWNRSDRSAALGGGQVSAPRRTRQAC